MKFLKFFLYFICFVSLSWATLVLGGPSIIKSLVASFSNSQITASGITVTPKLDIKIRQLEYDIKNTAGQINYEGLSRSINVFWSVFSDKPFIEIQVGPTFIQDLIAIDQIKIRSMAVSEISFQNLLLDAEMENIRLKSATIVEDLSLQGMYHLEQGLFSEVSVVSPLVSTDMFGSWSFKEVFAKTGEVDATVPLGQQAIMLEISATNALDKQTKVNLSNLNGVLNFGEDKIGFRLNDGDFANVGSRGFLGKIRAEGVYSLQDFLKEAHVELLDLSNNDLVLDQSDISIDISNSGSGSYKLVVLGELGAFDLTYSENYFGEFPDSKFEIEIELDSLNAQIDAIAQLELENLTVNEITVASNLSLTLDQDKSLLSCFNFDCFVAALVSDYKVAFVGEWISGNLKCSDGPCDLRSISHTVKTSDTEVIFSKISESRIINPLHAFYLYGFITGGTRLGNGHQIKIN